MHGAERDVGGLILGEQQHLVAIGNFGGAADHDPVLGTVVVHLQAEGGAGVDDDALDLETGAGVDAVVPAPGAVDLAVGCGQRFAFALDALDDLLDILGAGFVGDHDGVGGFYDDEILDADGGDEAALREDEAVLGVFEHDLALRGIAGSVFVADGPEGVPGADVAPAGIHGYNHGLAEFGVGAEFFHDGVVDGIRRAGGEGVFGDADEVAIALAVGNGGFAGGGHVGLEAGECLEPDAGAHHEDAGVPQVLAAGDVFGGAGGVGLFDKGVELAGAGGTGHEAAGAQVSVAGFCPVGDDAEGDECAGFGLGQAFAHGGEEGGGVGDDLVGRHHQQDGVAPFLGGDEGGELHGGGGVAAHGLEHDAVCAFADLAQLLGNDEAVFFVGDDDGAGGFNAETVEPARGDLQQGFGAGERQELLGVGFAGGRPQAGAGTTGEDDGLEHGVWLLSGIKNTKSPWLGCGFIATVG